MKKHEGISQEVAHSWLRTYGDRHGTSQSHMDSLIVSLHQARYRIGKTLVRKGKKLYPALQLFDEEERYFVGALVDDITGEVLIGSAVYPPLID